MSAGQHGGWTAEGGRGMVVGVVVDLNGVYVCVCVCACRGREVYSCS